VDATLAEGPLLAAGVARTVGDALPAGATLVASSSMPVRDVDAFLRTGPSPLRVLANRGANGIDGVVSTAWGVTAADDAPTALLIGDLALLHDVGGLVAAAQDPTPLLVVVVDDAGGGIFSFLPIAALGDAVDYDRLFRTPQAVGIAEVAGLAGVRYRAVADVAGLVAAVTEGCRGPGVTVAHVRIDADENLAQHRAVTAAVAAALP
jgi:2-succinyl-5-enolpyruvyl-6-hydroxy-3-cyclohexene-1-carboxylate synthase